MTWSCSSTRRNGSRTLRSSRSTAVPGWIHHESSTPPSASAHHARARRSRSSRAGRRTTRSSSPPNNESALGQHVTVAETKTRAHPKSSLDLPVTALPGVGGESEKLLERLEIHTIGDLLWHLPRTYHDFSKFVPVRALRAGKKQTVEAILGHISQRRTA